MSNIVFIIDFKKKKYFFFAPALACLEAERLAALATISAVH